MSPRRLIGSNNTGRRYMNALAPLYVKYRTESGTPYLYDALTGEIIQVSDTLYDVVDDCYALSDGEVRSKHDKLDRETLNRTIIDHRSMESKNVLRRRGRPACNLAPQMVEYQDRRWSCADFVAAHCRTLILEVTQQCNLRCEYCCYGPHYSVFRPHGSESMTWEIAEKAVESFFERLMDDYGVSFYGGEPLLALNLIKRVIHLVEEKGRNLDGKRGSFNITTNGTLLDDDTIHFLVQHNVNVLISLDGPKEFHDRYRVFHDATGKKKGTFDVVMKNLERFVELYPTYHLRGINLVLAPPIGFDETNAFLRDLVPHFPVSRVSFLQPCHRHASHNDGSSFHVGCGPTQCAQCPAGWFTCGKLPDGNGNGALQASQNASRASSVIGRDTRAESSAPAFASWSVATKREYGVWLRRYVDCVKEKGPRQASFEFPLIHQLLLASLFSVHLRPLTKSVEQTSYLRCLPGYPRLFCTTSGDYYPCERGPTNNTSRLGNVRTGLDPQASIRLVRLLQTMTDCGNCFAARFCGICPVNIHESDGPTGWDGAAMQHNCHEAQHFLGDLLVIYTEILENRPSAFDELMDSGQLEAILAMSLNVLPAPEESRTAASVERLIENKMLW